MRILNNATGYWIEPHGPWNWRVGIEDRAVGCIKGHEAWKVWHLLEHQDAQTSSIATYEPEKYRTYQECVAEGAEWLSHSKEAKRIEEANCHGTRQYLEHANAEIEFVHAPIHVSRNPVDSGDEEVVTTYKNALQRFGAPFSFCHVGRNGSGIIHSGRVLSAEGVCFEKTSSGGTFLLHTIEEVIHGNRKQIIFAKKFPEGLKPSPTPHIPAAGPDAKRHQSDMLFSLCRRKENELYIRKIRDRFSQQENI